MKGKTRTRREKEKKEKKEKGKAGQKKLKNKGNEKESILLRYTPNGVLMYSTLIVVRRSVIH